MISRVSNNINKLDFHFNAALTAVNLVKQDWLSNTKQNTQTILNGRLQNSVQQHFDARTIYVQVRY